MDILDGGYVIHQIPAVLRGINAHSAGLPGRPISQGDLRATNSMASTAWATDKGVAWTARELLAQDIRCPVVPGQDLEDILSRLPGEGHSMPYTNEEFGALSPADRKRFLSLRGLAHRGNTSRMGKRKAFMDALETATDMESYPAYWFNVTHDFRYRRYSVACSGLSPQGDDFSKSLLRFSVGKTLGAQGLYWLCVRAANCHAGKTPEAPLGLDKAHPDIRYAWAMDNAKLFRDIAANPLQWDRWSETGEPWMFLATALELGQAFAMRDPTEFVSHLSVPLDGSVNGLQHLSAMGRDPIGARATNLFADCERQDAYLEVAAAAQKIVESDAAKGRPEALAWYGNVTRASVKRAVLATPYGVTPGGIQRQLMEDKLVPQSDTCERTAMASYFRDVLVDSLAETVVGAKAVMAWLQTCATRLGEAGLPVDWVTPMGSTCRQAYYSREETRVRTLCGAVVLTTEVEGGMIDTGKQALGISPQVVHSFDAAHLAATVNLCTHLGIDSFAMIHDSFGTHAADTGTLNAALRQTFVDQYRPCHLTRLAEGFQAQAAHVDIPAPPPVGSFDVAANVPGSVYFFA